MQGLAAIVGVGNCTRTLDGSLNNAANFSEYLARKWTEKGILVAAAKQEAWQAY